MLPDQRMQPAGQTAGDQGSVSSCPGTLEADRNPEIEDDPATALIGGAR